MRQQRLPHGPAYDGEDEENNPYHHQQHMNRENDFDRENLYTPEEILPVDDYDDDFVSEEDDEYDEDDETSGVIPRIIRDLFQAMSEAKPSLEYIVRCSYIEIYLEKVFDLLDP